MRGDSPRAMLRDFDLETDDFPQPYGRWFTPDEVDPPYPAWVLAAAERNGWIEFRDETMKEWRWTMRGREARERADAQDRLRKREAALTDRRCR